MKSLSRKQEGCQVARGLLRVRHISSLKHREARGEQGLMEETRSQSMTETHHEDSYNQELEH